MLISPLTPHLFRETPNEGAAGSGEPPAYQDHVPDNFVGEDGNVDWAGFRTSYDDAVAGSATLHEEIETLKGGVPESPDAYDFTVPEDLDYGDLDLPEGFTVQIDPENPLFGEFRTTLHEAGIKADVAPKLMGLMAKYEASRFAQAAAAQKEDLAQLGPALDARVGKIQRALETKIPDEAQRAALMGSVTSAAGVRALETLLTSSQSKSNPVPTKTDADFEGMTPMQRLKAVTVRDHQGRRGAA